MISILTASAERDIRGILRDTLDLFGPNQMLVYGQLIETAIDILAENPRRLGSQERPEVSPNCRSLHLNRAASRKDAAAHALYYAIGRGPGGEEAVIVLRVLHEQMEPRSRVKRAMRETIAFNKSAG